jgi:thiamine transport system ATP-binding protein
MNAAEDRSVRLEQVAFRYPGGAPMLFDGVAASGAITALMGPSGSGKSTLLNLVAGFETPESGRILIGGRDVAPLPPAERPVSMVFQENNLFAHLTVAQNVGLGISPGLRLSVEQRSVVAQALARTGLAGKEERLPRELSGGERQRVALARVLVRRRPVLLLDEPFASLGPALRDGMLDLVAGLNAEHGLTVLFVTHQPEDAERIARNVLFLEEGRIVAHGPAADFFGGIGPESFLRYIGDRSRDGRSREIARKGT